MCLSILKSAKLQVATKDMICYKIFNKTDTNELLSAWIFHPYKRNQKYTSDLYKRYKQSAKKEFYWEQESTIFDYLDVGIHSFKNRKDALYWLKIKLNDTLLVALKCIIPKGAKYYKGTWESQSTESYASDTIITGKRIIKI